MAKVIANYLGIKSFESDWDQVRAYLNPGEHITKTFLSSKQFEQPYSLSDLDSSIIFGGLNELVLSKKIKISSCLNFTNSI